MNHVYVAFKFEKQDTLKQLWESQAVRANMMNIICRQQQLNRYLH